MLPDEASAENGDRDDDDDDDEEDEYEEGNPRSPITWDVNVHAEDNDISVSVTRTQYSRSI